MEDGAGSLIVEGNVGIEVDRAKDWSVLDSLNDVESLRELSKTLFFWDRGEEGPGEGSVELLIFNSLFVFEIPSDSDFEISSSHDTDEAERGREGSDIEKEKKRNVSQECNWVRGQ